MRFKLRPQDAEFTIHCDCNEIREIIASRYRILSDDPSAASARVCPTAAGFQVDIMVALDPEGCRRLDPAASFECVKGGSFTAYEGDPDALPGGMRLYRSGQGFLLHRAHDLALLYQPHKATVVVGENRYRDNRYVPMMRAPHPELAKRAAASPPAAEIEDSVFPVDDILELLRFTYAYHHSLISLHGAVAEWENRGIVIFAPSGGGKSTTALALAVHGARLCSDENLFIEESGDNLSIWGLALPLRLAMAQALARTVRDGGPEPGFHSQTKQEIPLDSWGVRIAVGYPVIPHVLFFLGARSGREETVIHRLGQMEAVERMMAQVLEAAVPLRNGVIGLRIIELASKVPAWEVHAGSDLKRLADCLLTHVSNNES